MSGRIRTCLSSFSLFPRAALGWGHLPVVLVGPPRDRLPLAERPPRHQRVLLGPHLLHGLLVADEVGVGAAAGPPLGVEASVMHPRKESNK